MRNKTFHAELLLYILFIFTEQQVILSKHLIKEYNNVQLSDDFKRKKCFFHSHKESLESVHHLLFVSLFCIVSKGPCLETLFIACTRFAIKFYR